MKKLIPVILTGIVMAGCNGNKEAVNVPCEKYTLPNGLQVVLQKDLSDPVVAVAIQYHVGSAREKEGKTGFAHFFEHMLFQRSENLPRNAFFQKISELGGEFNGGTDSDGTVYFEKVPRDALEKVLWMESDRMGYFINTVTQGGLEREIDVVSNEKRQSYDTRPYGQLLPIFSRYAFPEGHPYSWTTIGELDDLRAATVGDVKEFYHEYYNPNNATLVISGDFDTDEAKALVEKYFGEIAAGPEVKQMPAMPSPLAADVKVVHEDAFASMPLLAIAYPTVPKYHPDSYAVQMLSQVLADGKNSPLYKVVVDGKKLSPEIQMWPYERELAGNMLIISPAFEGTNLNDLYAAIEEAFDLFEKEGFDAKLLEGYKAVSEVQFYNSMGGVMDRALQIARENAFGGDPLRGFKEMELYNRVTKQDVIDAYNKYVKGQHAVLMSFVPQGAGNLALTGSGTAVVSVEKISDQAMKSQEGALVDDDYEHSASAIDRSVEPALLANTPKLNVPHVWKEQADGLRIWGATNDEMPVVRFSIILRGGQLYDDPAKAGVASLYAETLLAGTEDKTPGELEDAFKRLGATVHCGASTEDIEISGSVLKRNLEATMALLTEVLTRPRFDENEFGNQQQSALASIAMQADDAGSIAGTAIRRVLYGNSILANQVVGRAESVAAITLDDLKAYHAAYVSPAVADIHFAGSIDDAGARQATRAMRAVWKSVEVAAPAVRGETDPSVAGKVYFVDQPGSQQSVIMACSPAMPRADKDFYPAYLANYRLGDGSQGILFNELRLKRGYTYGAYSRFACGNCKSTWTFSSKVQGIKTRESLEVARDILAGYAAGFSDEDMELTRASVGKANFGAYETTEALVDMLTDISLYGLPDDYVTQREAVLNGITTQQVRDIAARYIDPARMTWVVVGDAATQLDNVKKAGLGTPVLLDKQGNPVK